MNRSISFDEVDLEKMVKGTGINKGLILRAFGVEATESYRNITTVAEALELYNSTPGGSEEEKVAILRIASFFRK